MSALDTSRPPVLRRVAPAVGLVLLAPLVAEFLLGTLPITLLPAMLLLAPLYGGGALLIREVTRRAGRGVPTMLVLGVAYGLIEEGIATQSLFNPHYLGVDLLATGFVPALGIAAPWTVAVLSPHAVWSTTAPIVLVELLSGDAATHARRDRGRAPHLRVGGLPGDPGRAGPGRGRPRRQRRVRRGRRRAPAGGVAADPGDHLTPP